MSKIIKAARTEEWSAALRSFDWEVPLTSLEEPEEEIFDREQAEESPEVACGQVASVICEQEILARIEQARSEGYEQGRREEQANRKAALEELTNKVQRLQEQWDELRGRQEELIRQQREFFQTQLVPLVMAITRKFLRFRTDDVVDRVVETAVQTLAEWQPSFIKLEVSPEDLVWWREIEHQLQQTLPDGRGLQLLVNEDLPQGDWFLDTDRGGMFSSREEQLRIVENVLAEALQGGVDS